MPLIRHRDQMEKLDGYKMKVFAYTWTRTIHFTSLSLSLSTNALPMEFRGKGTNLIPILVFAHCPIHDGSSTYNSQLISMESPQPQPHVKYKYRAVSHWNRKLDKIFDYDKESLTEFQMHVPSRNYLIPSHRDICYPFTEPRECISAKDQKWKRICCGGSVKYNVKEVWKKLFQTFLPPSTSSSWSIDVTHVVVVA